MNIHPKGDAVRKKFKPNKGVDSEPTTSDKKLAVVQSKGHHNKPGMKGTAGSEELKKALFKSIQHVKSGKGQPAYNKKIGGL